jgi:FKBP-type peptidyl-prolyl cis-trans isomerase
MRSALFFGLIGLLYFFAATGLVSCGSGNSPSAPQAPVFQKSTDGSFEYCLVRDQQGPTVQVGDQVEVHWRWFAGNEQLQSTYALNGGPMAHILPEDSLQIFFDQGIKLMSVGDSLIARFPVDAEIMQMVSNFNIVAIGDTLTLHYSLVSIISKADAEANQKIAEAKFDSLEKVVKNNSLAYMKKAKEIKKMTLDFAGEIKKNPSNASLTTLPSGIKISFLEKGNGPTAGPNDCVIAYISVASVEKGEELQSSYTVGQAVPFFLEAPYDQDGVCREWKQAMRQLPEGTKAMLVVPTSVCPSQGGLSENDSVIIFMEVIGVVKLK